MKILKSTFLILQMKKLITEKNCHVLKITPGRLVPVQSSFCHTSGRLVSLDCGQSLSHAVTFLNSFSAWVSRGERLGPEQDVSQGVMGMAH